MADDRSDEVAAKSLTSRIAMWSSRHRRLVILGWVIMIVGAFGACLQFPADTNIQETVPGEAQEGLDLIDERFAQSEDHLTEFLVFSHDTLLVDDPAYEAAVTGLVAEVRALRHARSRTIGSTPVISQTRIVGNTLSHYDIGVPRDVSPFVATRDGAGDVSFAILQLEGDLGEALDNIQHVLDTVEAYELPEGLDVVIGGDASAWKQSMDIIEEDFNRASFINLPVTFVILLLAFGAVLAAVVPLILAFAAIFVAMGILSIVSQGSPLADVYSQVVLLIGLATGIDYALFVISRFRNERAAGKSKEEALRIANGTSGKAIAFAGTTTVFAVAGMFLVGDAIFTSLAIASIVVVIVALASSVTLLPAIIGFLGDNVNRLTIPFLRRAQGGGEGFWGFVVDRALRWPLVSASVAIVALLIVSAPLLTLNLGFNAARGLNDAVEAKQAFITLEENFTLGLAQPAIVVVDAGEKRNVFASETQTAVSRFLELIEAESTAVDPDNFYGAIAEAPDFSEAGDAQLIFVPIQGDSGEQIAIDAVNHLRNDLIPQAFRDTDAEVFVTGSTAFNIDFRDNIMFRTPFVLAFVLGLAFLILLLTFRSVVIAITAICLNLLSVGFAYGLLVLVFQEGWLLEGVLGFEATGIIESWLPLFLFSILFGLSIDYEMYVMTRIKELKERGQTTQDAIANGVKGTAGVITNAAAIMVAVALIFAFMRNIGLQQFGFALAAAIFIDATVIRAFVLPTVMKLLGEWNWYFPKWLNWLPRIPMAE